MTIGPRAPSQYAKRRLFVRSRKVSKPRDWYFKLSCRFEIWQAHRQHCCRSACQISERSDNSNYKSRGFETLRDLTKRRLFGYWDGALICNHFLFSRGGLWSHWKHFLGAWHKNWWAFACCLHLISRSPRFDYEKKLLAWTCNSVSSLSKTTASV